MPTGSTNTPQFLVSPRTSNDAGQEQLQRFARKCEETDGVTVVKSVGQPVPRRLIVAMAPELATQFKREFGSNLIIEPNAELNLF